MEPLLRIQDFTALKLLGDPRRLAIMRLLMAKAATLSQLGDVLGAHPAQIRHHLKLLEGAGLVEMTSTRAVRGFVEKYYRATARAYYVNLAIVPKRADRRIVLALGSDDPALNLLAQQLRKRANTPDMINLAVGSLEGLIALRQGVCHLSGCHLLDLDGGEYNLPYVRRLFPGRSMVVVTLAHRVQGLLVPPGNPQRLQDIEDLARSGIKLINREAGSGTRLWLDQRLQKLGISPQQVVGYAREVNTHSQVAEAVTQGEADVGLGVLAAARRFNLDFVPLFKECFDLVIPGDQYYDTLLRPLLNTIHSAQFRRAMVGLGGYDTSHTGEEFRT